MRTNVLSPMRLLSVVVLFGLMLNAKEVVATTTNLLGLTFLRALRTPLDEGGQ